MRTLLLSYLIIALFLANNLNGEYVDLEYIIRESDNIDIKPNDKMQCITMDAHVKERDNYIKIFTAEANNIEGYHYMQATEKCFSFKISAPENVHIALSSTPYLIHDNRLEIVFDWADIKASVIRKATPQFDMVSVFNESKVLGGTEYRGFWIKWFDNHFLEVGRDKETEPFLYHRFNEKLNINYVGYMTFFAKGKWLFDTEPKCPGIKHRAKRMVKTKCLLPYSLEEHKEQTVN